MSLVTRVSPQRLALWTAVAGTVIIAGSAFSLSFRSLADLAQRSGIPAGQAWMWPLIVDGIIVVSTVSVVALAGHKSNWYPWLLLGSGAAVSVTANAARALVAADADVPRALAACVAAVPPLVLLAITHLTVVLTRRTRIEPAAPTSDESNEPMSEASNHPGLTALPEPRAMALRMRADGLSNKAIAKATGVHPSTVGRWFSADSRQRLAATSADNHDAATARRVAISSSGGHLGSRRMSVGLRR